jgi:hypothetical protein
MTQDVLSELKEKWKGWEESIMIRRASYIVAKNNMNYLKQEYRKSRSIYGKTYKQWREARIEAERAKRRFKTYPYNVRQWAKKNFGKVWEMLEKEKVMK